MRTCAICGCSVVRDLCNDCYEKWCPGGVYPEWVTELINMQYHFEMRGSAKEIDFSDCSEEELTPFMGED